MRVLAVFAHPDDEVLAVGGTLARHEACGDETAVLLFTDGVGSRGNEDLEARAQRRKNERDAALARLRVSRVYGADNYPDQCMDTCSRLRTARDIERVLADWGPAIVYTHHPGDLNQDHAAVARGVLVACRPTCETTVRRVLACEVAESTWMPGSFPFMPAVFSTFGEYEMAAKLAALEAYASEARAWPHPRSAKAVEARARLWGGLANAEFAEAFTLLSEVLR